MTDHLKLTSTDEMAVWSQLNKRRWFGHHVDDEEIESLEADIHTAVEAALRPDPEGGNMELSTNRGGTVVAARPRSTGDCAP